MDTIATVTLNPALDVNTTTEKVRPTHKLRCSAPEIEPGGGGINVARVLHALGADVTAIFPSGGAPGATIEKLLRDAGVPIVPVLIAGTTRENIAIEETSSGAQYRFVLPGPALFPDDLEHLFDALRALPSKPTCLVLSGSLPPGCDPSVLARLAEFCRGADEKLVIDTSGPALAGCEGARAYLIKPSLRELEELIGRKLDTEADEAAAAHELVKRDFAEVVVVSLGGRGALLASAEETIRMAALPVPPGGGTMGAGDAMVAALTLATARGYALADALRFGVAAGAAALMTPPAELVRREDVERLYATALAGSGSSTETGSSQNRP